MLKRPDSIPFTKKNDVHPFEDAASLNFWSEKNDASLFCVGLHSKKRPHDLVFARMFAGQVLDMVEVGVEMAQSMAEFKVRLLRLSRSVSSR
jgi:ribosome production factor 2